MEIPNLSNNFFNNIIMYVYHPKIRKFTKLFINDYYNEILCNNNEYYYDIIMKGLNLINNCDFYKFKELMNQKNGNTETNIKLLSTNSRIPILFYEEKCINTNKPITILFLGTNKNRCLFMKIIEDYAYIENLSTEINNTNDIDEILNNYFTKNGVKNIIIF
jgi:hypothetical protein